jgi:mannose-1-phosphate guanylyltransferase/mannose-6-phosphate isomerase
MIIPVILAGGIGSRLWPLSRGLLPKQFIQFPNHQASLFQNTISRLEGLDAVSVPMVICNEEHRFLVAEQLRLQDKADGLIVLEPFGKNTAPAAAIAALLACEKTPQAILLVLPADHVIKDDKALHKVINEGRILAEQGRLVTFGIVPDKAETGYGYIRKAERIAGFSASQVAEFVEKPDLEAARRYLKNGNYLWNSGMFMFSAKRYLEELTLHAPDILEHCEQSYRAMSRNEEFLRLPTEQFAACRSESIDYALMEKTVDAVVVPLNADWNDLGTWSAVFDTSNKDESNNVSSGDVMLSDASNCYLHASSRLLAVHGLQDMVIVETSDAVLVAAMDKVQGVKQIVESLQKTGRKEHSSHDLVYRPWGSYESLVNAKGYQVKHIIVKPGASISLQMHHHRSEHWTVIHGEATITRDDEVFTLQANASTYIPVGCKHRLENRGLVNVELIEVQVGDYLGEDDIVRFEDIYGRVPETK